MIHLVYTDLGCCLDILSMCFVVASSSPSRARRPVYGVFSQKAVRLLASTALHLAPRRGVASVSRAQARRELLTAAARAKVSRFLSFGRTVGRTADHSKASCL